MGSVTCGDGHPKVTFLGRPFPGLGDTAGAYNHSYDRLPQKYALGGGGGGGGSAHDPRSPLPLAKMMC